MLLWLMNLDFAGGDAGDVPEPSTIKGHPYHPTHPFHPTKGRK